MKNFHRVRLVLAVRRRRLDFSENVLKRKLFRNYSVVPKYWHKVGCSKDKSELGVCVWGGGGELGGPMASFKKLFET